MQNIDYNIIRGVVFMASNVNAPEGFKLLYHDLNIFRYINLKITQYISVQINITHGYFYVIKNRYFYYFIFGILDLRLLSKTYFSNEDIYF